MLRIGVLASHEGTTAQSLIDACHDGLLPAIVALVLSNNADAGALRRAIRAGIPSAHVSGRTHPDESDRDRAIEEALAAAEVDLVILAGYMKRIGPRTLSAYRGRILNTHPALLPSFGGVGMYGDRVHAAVLESGVAVSGATVHVVTTEYDKGPILAQVEVPVVTGDTVTSLGTRVRAAEKYLLLEVVAGRAQAAAGHHTRPTTIRAEDSRCLDGSEYR